MVILKTLPLTDLVWTGRNDKKTANVPAGEDFEFYPDRLPSFSWAYYKPEEFTILYKDEFGVMQPLECNYVNNGHTKYAFSFKKDNDVITLDVYKSDGHLTINVRNDKLDIPMDLNNVEFQVIYSPILLFTTTFNRYAIVDVLVKEDGSTGIVNVRRLTDDDVDLDYTYETVLRAACTFRQDLIVGVEVEMNKPDNVAANYTVKSTKIFINGEEI